MKQQHGCPWKGPLAQLEEHLKECQFADINCPGNCGQQIQKKDLQQHLENYCPFRTLVSCDYCKAIMPLNATENHYQNCPKYPLRCEKCRKENIPREKMTEHLDKACPLVEVKCPFFIIGCSFEGLQLDVVKHVKEQMVSHMMDMAKKLSQVMSQPSGAETGAHRGAPTGCLTGTMESPSPEQTSQEERLNELQTRVQHQQNEIDGLRRIITSLCNTVRHLERQLEEARIRQERPVHELTLRFNQFETKLLEYEGCVCNGTYIWKIENYQQHCQDDFNAYSPPFCTSPHGYKLCLWISLHGNHMGLFVYMMQGCYDNTLKWPFTGMITLSILDQSGAGNHLSRTFLAKPYLPSFQQPTSMLNPLGYGYTDFAPINLEQIHEGEYVKNNTVLLKFEFHPI